jgi:hypothetical protein
MSQSVPASTSPVNTTSKPSVDTKIVGGLGVFGVVIGTVVGFLFHLGAAYLSYAKYGSIGWAILDFFFATMYYPFYALVLNEPCNTPMSVLGGRRRK